MFVAGVESTKSQNKFEDNIYFKMKCVSTALKKHIKYANLDLYNILYNLLLRKYISVFI